MPRCLAICPQCGAEKQVEEPKRTPPIDWPRCRECKGGPLLIVYGRRPNRERAA